MTYSEPQNSILIAPCEFTAQDRAVLQAVVPLVNAVATLLGPFCEAVVHSLEAPTPKIIAIANGQVSGRNEGKPLTPRAIAALQHAYYGKGKADVQLIIAANKRRLKGITCAICNDAKLLGYFSINLHIDAPASETAGLFTLAPGLQGVFAHQGMDLEQFIEQSLREVVEKIDNNTDIKPRMRIKNVVLELNARNIFSLRGALEFIALRLGISKDVIYMHLRNSKP